MDLPKNINALTIIIGITAFVGVCFVDGGMLFIGFLLLYYFILAVVIMLQEILNKLTMIAEGLGKRSR